MRKFLLNITFAITIIPIALFLISLVIGVFPPNKNISNSLLFGKIQKDALLENINKPRIILVGGSNVSFGVNSQMLLDSLSLHPINTAIQASIGLEFMLDNVTNYLDTNDIILIIPEYSHFIDKNIHGGDEMILTSVEVDKFESIRDFSLEQLIQFILRLPKVMLQKIGLSNVFIRQNPEGIYGVYSFNKFGDATKHYGLKNEEIPMDYESYSNTSFNKLSISIIQEFIAESDKKSAKVIISYPSFQQSYSMNNIQFISYLDSTLIANEFNVISNPKDFILPDSLFFNTHYHLNEEGVNIRTLRLIKDINNWLKSN